ncbi:MAG: nuclear transport factor 2 family protein [Bacteroidota bacterium]
MRFAVYFLLACCFTLPIDLMAQKEQDNIEEVRQALERQAERWNAGDIEGFMEDYWKSDRLQFIGQDGITYGWKATLERYQKSYPDKATMGKLSFDILDITQRGRKVISLAGTFLLERKSGDLNGHFLLIWKKIKGRWVIVADHTCS